MCQTKITKITEDLGDDNGVVHFTFHTLGDLQSLNVVGKEGYKLFH